MTAQELKLTEDTQIATSDPGEILMNAPLLAQIDAMAKRMATAKATIPQHLAGNQGDCWAVIMQALQWGMNPFVVAQKTHVVNGSLGYEAQLVNAVVKSSGAISGAFKYEYRGDGESLECRVGAVLKGEENITWNEWLMLSSVKVRNSPLWKTNQKQQMGYLQVKNWTRLYAPEALLGIYTTDELRDQPPSEREVGPRASELTEELRQSAQPAAAAATAEAEPAADIAEGEVIEDAPPASTVAEMTALINGAPDLAALSHAHTTVKAFLDQEGNDQYLRELTDTFKTRKAKLEAEQPAQEPVF